MSILSDIKRGRIPGTKKKIPGSKQVGQAVDIPKQVAKEVEKVVPDVVKKELGKALKTALQQFFKLLFNPLNRKAINILKAAGPDTVWLSVGIVTLTVNEVPKKIGKIEYWLEHPPIAEKQLGRMVADLAPADVEIALKGNIPGLSVGAGATLVYLPEDFVKRLPKIWHEIKDFI